MTHDRELLDQLSALPQETFDGEVFRATRINLNPLAGSYNGGRWMPRDTAAILYTSLLRDGALAEIAFHFSQLDPKPSKSVMVHRLRVVTQRALKLIRADLRALSVDDNSYQEINLVRTQAIGAAVEFLGCDGLIAPSARWLCDNLMVFPERMSTGATLEVITSESVDWSAWATTAGFPKNL